MEKPERESLIRQYSDGYGAIVTVLEGMTDEEWDAREAPGEWSPREIVHHLADSEMTSAIRIRRLLVEDNPVIQGYDQEAFAQTLFYDRPIDASLQAFRYARESTVPILERMSDEQWQRSGTHSESGLYTATGWLEIYAVHAHDHADQIRRTRAAR